MTSIHIPQLLAVMTAMLTLADWYKTVEPGQLGERGFIDPSFHLHRVPQDAELVAELMYLVEAQPEFTYGNAKYTVSRHTNGTDLTWFTISAGDKAAGVSATMGVFVDALLPERSPYWEQAQKWRQLREWAASLGGDGNSGQHWYELVTEQDFIGIDWDEAWAGALA